MFIVKIMLGLFSIFVTFAVYAGIFLLLYKSYKYAKAHTVDQLVTELTPRAEKWTATAVFAYLLRTICFVMPAIAIRIIISAVSLVMKNGLNAIAETAKAVKTANAAATTVGSPTADPAADAPVTDEDESDTDDDPSSEED